VSNSAIAASARTCAAYRRTRDGILMTVTCGEPAPHEAADTFLCDCHYRRALKWAEDAARCQAETVYYVQREDGLIKIGTSRTTASRLAYLAREYGPLSLMAFHGGGRQEEAAAHRAFKALRVEGEWFRPGLPLLEHIVEIRKTMGNLEYENDGMPPRMSRAELREMIRDLRAQNDGPEALRSALRSQMTI